MSLTSVDTIGTPARAPRRAPPAVRGKLKTALDDIVWNGKPWIEAARDAGISTQAVRKALAKPHIQKYLRDERHVFRESARAQNIHAAIEVRDQKVNQTARIQAARYIDGEAEARERDIAGRQVTPGVVITVNVNRDVGQVDETIIEVGPGAYTDTQSGGLDPEKR